MPKELTVAEVRQHAGTSNFTAVRCQDGDWMLSWVQTRGRLESTGGDSGKDLVVLKQGGFPRVLWRGEPLTGGIVFSPGGGLYCFQSGQSLVYGKTTDLSSTKTWLSLHAGESFVGSPVWIREETVLLGVRGGEPKRDRLFVAPSVTIDEEPARIGPLFVSQEGGTLLSWDHSQNANDDRVVLVHRLANAMLAEIVLVSRSTKEPTVLTVDVKVEYCKPQATFLASGDLLLRCNALILGNDGHLRDARLLEELPNDIQNFNVKHGLWLWRDDSSKLQPLPVIPNADHGTYDVCSGSYGRLGASEGLRLDPGRTKVVVTARPVGGDNHLSYSDDLYLLDFAAQSELQLPSRLVIPTSDEKGCKVPVAVTDTQFVYHFRSPTESGDLYLTNLPTSSNVSTSLRLTETMPLSLKPKLVTPQEVTICNPQAPFRDETALPLPIHALLYLPNDSNSENQPLQPVLWLHGGPMCQYSYDCNPLLSWLANSCGYVVLAPNFSGSTGNGVEFMNRVLGEGCGVADLSDCLACAEWLQQEAKELEPRLDLSRGIAVAGHSWGGYLAYRCMLESNKHTGESVFGCGIAAAGITDWFLQQRYTEVRYYDYALLGGWAYEVPQRAREASPQTRASDLKAPLLVLHGDQDVDVPFQQIPPFVEAARRNPSASVDYHVYEGEGHGLSGVQADYLNRIRTFLRIHLKPWDFTSNPHGDLTAY